MELEKTTSSLSEKGAEMSSVLRTVKKCKKSRVLGEAQVVSRDEYGGLELDSKVEMIRAL